MSTVVIRDARHDDAAELARLRPESHAFYPSAGFALAKTQHVYVRRLARAAGD
ncbi:MAG TPA: hypothetical protein VJ766_05615 [Pseudoxanthomonas sp.]|nr:hypothetical protein [Pseudoxanthomonas sp.]